MIIAGQYLIKPILYKDIVGIDDVYPARVYTTCCQAKQADAGYGRNSKCSRLQEHCTTYQRLLWNCEVGTVNQWTSTLWNFSALSATKKPTWQSIIAPATTQFHDNDSRFVDISGSPMIFRYVNKHCMKPWCVSGVDVQNCALASLTKITYTPK